jgi:UDP-glucose 4-epimerase
MKSLVIGGNGFIGSCLVRRLLAEGCQVVVLDVGQARGDFEWANVVYVQAALSDRNSLARALNGVQVVYHCASSTVPGNSNLDPVGDVEQNLVGMLNLLEEMRVQQVSRIVYMSSGGTVYGNPDVFPVGEDQPLHPICSYGVVKVAVEKYLHMYQELYGFRPVILRPSNPYGPGQRSTGIQGLIAAFLGRVKRGEPLSIWGDGEVVRDYIFIDDLIDVAVKAASDNVSGVFNVGSGSGHSVNEIARVIFAVTGKAPGIDYLPARSFDVRRIVLDIERARVSFDWSPLVSLEQGIERTWKWMLGSQ